MDIVYIHGFLSGSQAIKAGILRRTIAVRYPGLHFWAPDFPDTPAEAWARLQEIFAPLKGQELGLVGSSMGGLFATLLSIEYGFKAVLLNPCIHPQDYFSDLIGPQYNEVTDTHFELKPEMLTTLREFDAMAAAYDPHKIAVLLQDGDETLDYRKSRDFFAAAAPVVLPGGCHQFAGFADWVTPILDFLRAP